MKYELLKSETRCGIAKLTQQWVTDGWIPQGGICCVVVPEDTFIDDHNRCRSGRLHFYQAIIFNANAPVRRAGTASPPVGGSTCG